MQQTFFFIPYIYFHVTIITVTLILISKVGRVHSMFFLFSALSSVLLSMPYPISSLISAPIVSIVLSPCTQHQCCALALAPCNREFSWHPAQVLVVLHCPQHSRCASTICASQHQRCGSQINRCSRSTGVPALSVSQHYRCASTSGVLALSVCYLVLAVFQHYRCARRIGVLVLAVCQHYLCAILVVALSVCSPYRCASTICVLYQWFSSTLVCQPHRCFSILSV